MLFMYVCAYVSVHIYAVSAKVRRGHKMFSTWCGCWNQTPVCDSIKILDLQVFSPAPKLCMNQ